MGIKIGRSKKMAQKIGSIPERLRSILKGVLRGGFFLCFIPSSLPLSVYSVWPLQFYVKRFFNFRVLVKIIIAGGTGLIGRALRADLSSRGHKILVLSRRAPQSGGDVSTVFWDAKNLGTWQTALSGAGAVINLCGESIIARRWNTQSKNNFYDSRILSTRALVAALSQGSEKPSLLINASAIGFYGDRGDEELDEDSKPGADFFSKLCVEWEREAQIAQSLGIRTVCLRMGIVLSANGGALGRMALPFRLGLGGCLGDGRQWMSWIALEDLVALIAHLIDSDISGPINAVSPYPIKNEELTLSLAKALHRSSWARVPAWALKPLLGEVSSIVLSSQRVFPKKAETSGFQFHFPRLDSALDFALNRT
jgi:hypothetical protein